MRIAAFLAIAAIGSSALFLLLRSHESGTSRSPEELSELDRLRQRIAELEAENARLRESAFAEGKALSINEDKPGSTTL